MAGPIPHREYKIKRSAKNPYGERLLLDMEQAIKRREEPIVRLLVKTGRRRSEWRSVQVIHSYIEGGGLVLCGYDAVNPSLRVRVRYYHNRLWWWRRSGYWVDFLPTT